jgi:hypothetical protein
VKLKYHTGMSLGLQPSLTIGYNGGFQWLGNPTHIAESLSEMFAFISKNIMSKVHSISKSTSMERYIYPTGILLHIF